MVGADEMAVFTILNFLSLNVTFFSYRGQCMYTIWKVQSSHM